MYSYRGYVYYLIDEDSENTTQPPPVRLHSERNLFIEKHDMNWLHVATYSELIYLDFSMLIYLAIQDLISQPDQQNLSQSSFRKALREQVELKTIRAAHLAYITNTRNFYHLLLENMPIIHAGLCRLWGQCQGSEPGPQVELVLWARPLMYYTFRHDLPIGLDLLNCITQKDNAFWMSPPGRAKYAEDDDTLPKVPAWKGWLSDELDDWGDLEVVKFDVLSAGYGPYRREYINQGDVKGLGYRLEGLPVEE